ncbi:MAG TPA: hypothetical protein ENI64_12895 [Gammaproteobacteria bacterium]|nr:hypothetical protein [Gammaproteobacteria bacterium]
MAANPLLRWFFVTATLLLVAPVSAYALSVYDVIQLSKKNYSDQDIVGLIQATDSAFTLKAEDIIRLQGLGLSEPVIQAMVQAVPELATEHLPASNTHASSDTVPVTPVTTVADGLITVEPFQEAGSGHHHHNAINLAGVRLLVIRDEGLFPSVETRSITIAERLEQAVSTGAGAFHPGPATASDTVMYYGRSTDRPMLILNVSPSDAYAYQRRSGRTVTPALLAAYWSDLLSDYWSIAINRKPPERLSELHEGEVLNSLYEQWGKLNKTESLQFADAAQQLPRQQQQHLQRLAITVPHGFQINHSHLARQP